MKGEISRVLQLCGQESLYIYVLHLVVVYGPVLNSRLSYLSGGKIGPGIVFLVTVVLCGFCYFTARLWHESKKQYPVLTRRVIAGAISLYLVTFLVMP